MRTHISLPEDLVAEVDELAGPRGRSKFVEEAVRMKVVNERQRRMLKKLASLPPLDPEKYPYWRTPQDVSRWVRESRQLDTDRLEEKLRRSPE
jgi:hypothetical protein